MQVISTKKEQCVQNIITKVILSLSFFLFWFFSQKDISGTFTTHNTKSSLILHNQFEWLIRKLVTTKFCHLRLLSKQWNFVIAGQIVGNQSNTNTRNTEHIDKEKSENCQFFLRIHSPPRLGYAWTRTFYFLLLNTLLHIFFL